VSQDIYDKIVELAKRRGFFWPSYEIYGGVSGMYDLGPLGALLKRRIEEEWRRKFVLQHQDRVVEIETPIIGSARVYEASGHVESFTDPIVECSKCGRKYRADHLIEEFTGRSVEGLSTAEMTRIIREEGIRCPICNGELGEVKVFNLLFKTQIGPYEGDVGYVRPELAQGIFVSFKRVHEAMRGRLPLGVAQIGRVGRNEISPRQGMIRLREFTIAEMEYFFDPEEESCPWFDEVRDKRIRVLTCDDRMNGVGDPKDYTLEEAVRDGVIMDRCLAYWMSVAQEFVEGLGISPRDIYFEEKCPDERAHYSSQTFDQMVRVSRWGWVEVSGHSYRGDYDLSRHMRYSGQDLTVFKPYKEPVVVKRKKLIVNKAVIGRMFRERAPIILEEASRLDPAMVEEAIREGKPVKVADVEVPREAFKVEDVVEKISGKRFIPHVVEPSFGVERLVYVTLEHAYREKEGRVVLSIPRRIAPIQAVVLPLNESDEELVAVARELYEKLKGEGFTVVYDDTGSIGRRYARADEVGVPVAITIDYQTLEDGTVTFRDRDTWRQVRIPLDGVVEALRRFIYDNARLEDIGRPI